VCDNTTKEHHKKTVSDNTTEETHCTTEFAVLVSVVIIQQERKKQFWLDRKKYQFSVLLQLLLLKITFILFTHSYVHLKEHY